MTMQTQLIPKPYNEPVLNYTPTEQATKTTQKAIEQLLASKVEIPLVIQGEKIKTAQTTTLHSPHEHKRTIGVASTASKTDVERAVQSCLKAQKQWNRFPWQERAAVFLKAAELLTEKYRAKINAATIIGQSKTILQSEIDAICELADFWRYNAAFAEKIHLEQPYSPKGLWNATQARGLEGFVYAIGPFNFTSISVNLATAPALMGCAVLWKPASTAIYSSYMCLEILEEAGLPPGVINMVHGDPQVISDVALNHPEMAGIHFTGSTQTFNHLWSEVGKRISSYKSYPRLVGETGGKDFVFAHPSADIEALRTALIRGAFEYQGQKCSAASRAYIPKSVWSKLKDSLCSEIAAIKMGDPTDFSHFMGAVIDQRAFNKIKSYIEFAKSASDAKVLVGGECDSTIGYFVRPTLIQTTNPKFKTMVEEIFGPVLTIYVYEDEKMQDAIELCDQSTAYALTGAIFAQDRYAIDYLQSEFMYSAGNLYINDKPTGAVVGQQPFGGSRASGTNDKAGSTMNLLRWVSMRTIKENLVPPIQYRYPHM